MSEHMSPYCSAHGEWLGSDVSFVFRFMVHNSIICRRIVTALSLSKFNVLLLKIARSIIVILHH